MFSYLCCADLYHKISLLDKITRVSLPESGLLDQIKILTMKTVPLLKHSLKYAFRLVDIIHLEATKNSIQAVNQMGSLIDFSNSLGGK